MVKHSIIHSHFKKYDPILFSLVENSPIEQLTPRLPKEYFVSLCREIIGQQLSGRVADVIFSRFEDLFRTKVITPKEILRVSHETLRGIGMSRAKVRYVKDLAEKVDSHSLDLGALTDMSEGEVIAVLTEINGVGPWTAEMFLMFTLGREDVFSYGDLGLKKAIKELYGLKKDPTKKEMERLSGKWKPYRTYAALALWKFKDR